MMLTKSDYLNEGLVHLVYKKGNSVFKVPKDNFVTFNSKEHFEIEKTSLDILRNHGFPAVRVRKIYEKGELVPSKYVLEEDYLSGIVKDNKDISLTERRSIVDIMLGINQIKIPRFGSITKEGVGINASWREFLENIICDNTEILVSYLSDKKMRDILNTLHDFLNDVPQLIQGYFLLLDTNSNNFIFNEQGDIIGLIDVDHPASGDRLYDYAALEWFHPISFSVLEELIKFKDYERELMYYYSLLFGISTLKFEIVNNLDTKETMMKLYAKSI